MANAGIRKVTAIVFARKVVEQRSLVAPPTTAPFSGFQFQLAVRDAQQRPGLEQHGLERKAHARVRASALGAPQSLSARAVTAQPLQLALATTLAVSRRSEFTRLSTATSAMAASPPPEPVTMKAPTAPDLDSIYVLAFICKHVPLCPNPDATLQW